MSENAPETQPSPDDNFDLMYGWFVYDLVIQSRAGCHGNAWLKARAQILAIEIAADSGLMHHDVEQRLSALWGKIHEIGAQAFLEERSASIRKLAESFEDQAE